MEPLLAIGVAGMLFIVAGWAIALRSLNPPPLELSSLYAAGSLLLTVYAILLGDPIFTALNIAATLVALLNIARARGLAGLRSGASQAEGKKREKAKP